MKYSIIFVFTVGLTNATRFSDNSRKSESILEARDSDNYPHLTPHLFQRRTYVDIPFSDSHSLQRRADRQRTPSPMARVGTFANGPAEMSVYKRYGKYRSPKSKSNVGGGAIGTLEESLRMGGSLVGKIESTERPPYNGPPSPNQQLRAEFKGQTFEGRVSPPPGGRGNLRIERYGKAPVNIPVTGTHEHHPPQNYTSDKPGGLRVIATSDYGGKIKGEIYQGRGT